MNKPFYPISFSCGNLRKFFCLRYRKKQTPSTQWERDTPISVATEEFYLCNPLITIALPLTIPVVMGKPINLSEPLFDNGKMGTKCPPPHLTHRSIEH